MGFSGISARFCQNLFVGFLKYLVDLVVVFVVAIVFKSFLLAFKQNQILAKAFIYANN